MLKQFDPTTLYNIYEVTIQVRDRIVGGMPKSKELIEKWVRSTKPKGEPEDEKRTQEIIAEDLEVLIQDEIERTWIGFPSDSNGLFIPCRQIKACFKQSASLLQITKKKIGSKQILAEGMEIRGLHGPRFDRVYLGMKEPSGTEEKPIHIMTAQGPRSALKKYDFVTKPLLTFQVWILATHARESRHVGEDELVAILTHAQENGLGAGRSQGEGKFDVEKFSKIQEGQKWAPKIGDAVKDKK